MQPGDYHEETVENVDFGRIAAQTAKQVIVQRVRDAERAQIVDEYRGREGELLAGTVKKVTRDNIIVDLGNNAEGLFLVASWSVVRPSESMIASVHSDRDQYRVPWSSADPVPRLPRDAG